MPHTFTNGLKQCENLTSEFRVFCDKNDCEVMKANIFLQLYFYISQVDAITAARRCNLTNVQLCGGKVQKREDTNDTFDACTVVFKRPSTVSNRSELHPETTYLLSLELNRDNKSSVDEWNRDKNESGKMAKTNNLEDCGWNGNRSSVKIFCYEDGCDVR